MNASSCKAVKSKERRFRLSIGGSASNNGVKFISDNYVARFDMDKNNNYQISYNKRIKAEGIRKRIKKIPLLKGLYAMYEGNPIVIFYALFMLLMDFTHYNSTDNYLLLAVMSLVTGGCLIYLIRKVLYNVKDTWMYHGAEHKTIYAYENKEELTLENVRKSPRIAKRCGTNLVVFAITFYMLLSFFVDYQGVKFIISFLLGYEIFDIDEGDKYPVLNLFFKFGYWCQHNLFTKEPSDIQITASVDTIKRIIELENNII